MQLRRLINTGAVFADDLSSIQDLEKQGYTVNGNPTITNSPVGKAITFDGTGDYLDCENAEDLQSTSALSVSFWVYRTTGGVTQSIVAKDDDTNRNYGIQIQSDARIYFYKFTSNSIAGSNILSTGTITLNTWTHITCTYTSGVQKIYINGVVDGEGTDTGDIDNDDVNLTIGARANVDRLFTGAISNILIFNRALSQTEVTSIYEGKVFDYEKDLLSKWDMSQVNPSDLGWRNLGNDGTAADMDSTNIVNGFNGGKALQFNGSDEWIDCGLDANMAFGNNDFSFVAVVYIDSVPSLYNYIMSVGNNSSGEQCGFGVSDSNELVVSAFSSPIVITTATVDLKTWLVLGMSYTGGGTDIVDFYVDGDLLESESITLDVKEGNISLGSYANALGSPFSGKISEARIYNKALTAMEIKDITQTIMRTLT